MHAPLIDMGKGRHHPRRVGLRVDYSLTVSCYQADERGVACGAVIRAGCAPRASAQPESRSDALSRLAPALAQWPAIG